MLRPILWRRPGKRDTPEDVRVMWRGLPATARRGVTRALVSAACGALLVASATEARADDPPEEVDCATRVSKAGCYLDIDGKWKSPTAEYDKRWEATDPFHLLSLGEELLFLGAGIAWYAADDRNLADWDFPSWEQRFTLEAWRYDNNHFPINWMGHPLSGAAYYAFPRANDHSVWVSSTYAFMTSFVWEFLVEFREKISVNDLIATAGVGIVVGEFAHKLWRYFSGVPEDSTVVQDFLAGTLGFPIFIRNAIDGREQYVEGPYDELGYSNQIRKHLAAGYRVSLHNYGKEVVTHNAWLHGRFSSIPGAGRPGDFAMFFSEADIVEGTLSGGVGSNARNWELTANTLLLGLYGQHIDEEGDGYAGSLGWSLGYRYRFQDFDEYNDRIGIVHLPGIGTELDFRDGVTELRAFWRFNPDFAGLHSVAYPTWADQTLGPDDQGKTVLRKHKYYYAWGLSSRFGGQLTVGPVDVGAAVNIGVYDSHEGLDRSQEELTIDQDLGDRLLEMGLEVGFTIPTTTVRMAGGWSSNDRRSSVEEIVVDRNLSTWSVSLGASL